MQRWLSVTTGLVVRDTTAAIMVHSTTIWDKEYITITTATDVTIYRGDELIQRIAVHNIRGAIYQGNSLYTWGTRIKITRINNTIHKQRLIKIILDGRHYQTVSLPVVPRKLLAVDKRGIWWWLDNSLYCNNRIYYHFPAETTDVHYHRNRGKGTYLLMDGTIVDFTLENS